MAGFRKDGKINLTAVKYPPKPKHLHKPHGRNHNTGNRHTRGVVKVGPTDPGPQALELIKWCQAGLTGVEVDSLLWCCIHRLEYVRGHENPLIPSYQAVYKKRPATAEFYADIPRFSTDLNHAFQLLRLVSPYICTEQAPNYCSVFDEHRSVKRNDNLLSLAVCEYICLLLVAGSVPLFELPEQRWDPREVPPHQRLASGGGRSLMSRTYIKDPKPT